jgi:hypothetical protein
MKVDPKDVKYNLQRMVVASCTCLTKTPDLHYHGPECNYRQYKEILSYIEHLEDTIDMLTENRPR